MRLLFIADARSPIALNWIRHFTEGEQEVHLVSTFPAQPDLELASFHIVPVAFSGVKKGGSAGAEKGSGRALWKALGVGARTRVRQYLGPLTIPGAAAKLSEIARRIQPDLVHAMRIPYEGMLAARALEGVATPLLVSVWGNDFTLHAPSTPLMRRSTTRTLGRADALHADCHRDIRLALEWGFSTEKPALVVPGSGGVRVELFHLPPEGLQRPPVVVMPRSLRAYVCSDAYFHSIPLVLEHRPDARFLCPDMAGKAEALQYKSELGLGEEVELLPALTPKQMADLFRLAQVLVSPTTHDGTPNTLLEGMACGCFPVAGDLESIREWITPGENGLLCNPTDPRSIADATLQALENDDLREEAARKNAAIIAERAEYGQVMRLVEAFYTRVL